MLTLLSGVTKHGEKTRDGSGLMSLSIFIIQGLQLLRITFGPDILFSRQVECKLFDIGATQLVQLSNVCNQNPPMMYSMAAQALYCTLADAVEVRVTVGLTVCVCNNTLADWIRCLVSQSHQ